MTTKKKVKSSRGSCLGTTTSQNIDTPYFNDGCPICLNKERDMLILSCFHRIHSKCAEGLKDLLCPICRIEVNNWPPTIFKKIEKNTAERKQELIDEETEALRALSRSMMPSSIMFLQQLQDVEIVNALQYLYQEGIPYYYIPQQIHITQQRNHPQVEPGVLFTTIVGQVIKKVQEDLSKDSLRAEKRHPKEDDNSEGVSPSELENNDLSGIDLDMDFEMSE